MVTRLKDVDAVTVGLGWTGAIMARELTKAGLNVVSLERGPDRIPGEDFILPAVRDEVKYGQRLELMMDNSVDTITFRNFNNERALPIRRIGAFLPGEGVGGSGIHWGALHWRNLPSDFRIRSAIAERYGAKAIPDDMTIQDWPVSYQELEPYYDRFEKLAGISGKAGNLGGKIQNGGNPFEGPRSSEYPNPPLHQPLGATLYAKAARELGYHPFPIPSANMSQSYTNPLGVTLGQCSYCGFCERFGCGNYAKSSAQTCVLPALMPRKNFEARTNCNVTKINLDSTGKKATGVTYVDAEGQECEQT